MRLWFYWLSEHVTSLNFKHLLLGTMLKLQLQLCNLPAFFSNCMCLCVWLADFHCCSVSALCLSVLKNCLLRASWQKSQIRCLASSTPWIWSRLRAAHLLLTSQHLRHPSCDLFWKLSFLLNVLPTNVLWFLTQNLFRKASCSYRVKPYCINVIKDFLIYANMWKFMSVKCQI